MHILVFGGTGFVGLNIASAMLTRGHDVTLFDRADPPLAAQRAFAGYGDRLKMLQGDVLDRAAVDAAIGAGIDVIVMGRVTHRGIGRLVGSTVEHLLYKMPCSVWVVAPETLTC